MTVRPGGAPASRWLVVALAGAVLLAFADASVVVLALPAMYGEFETTVVGISWVITAYALVVALAGAAIAIVHRRIPSRAPCVGGLALFGISSAACALAPSAGWLVTARCAQGLGGALLLVGGAGMLAALDPGGGRRLWATCGTAGLAVGPALGGLITQWFTWRTIFVVQAPAALLAIAVSRAGRTQPVPPVRPVRSEHSDRSYDGGVGGLVLAASLLVSGALVGALFLAVLLVIEVWQFSPLGGAVVVSALPAGALAAGRMGATLGTVAGVGGCAVLAAGLMALAFLPAASPWWAGAALGLCGAGLGLATGVLDPLAARSSPRATALAVSSRHAGLVLGLALLAPVLAADLDRGAEQAALTGAATLLDARLDLGEKISVARDTRDEVDRTPRGQMPDLDRAFGGGGAERAAAGVELRADIEAVLTRSFRTGFGLAGALAVLAAVPTWLVARHAPRRRRGLVGALVAASAVLLVSESVAGAADFGAYRERDPCRAGPDAYPGDGFDATVQRIVLGGLDGAACELGVTREALVLSLDDSSGLATVRWDRPTVQRAVRAGLLRSIDDARERGAIPGVVAAGLRELAERTPVELALGAADVLRDGLGAVGEGLERLRDFFR
ncbi:MAG: MFS transporter [Acidimicrobiia bacterium]